MLELRCKWSTLPKATDNLSKPVGVWAGSQRLIPTDRTIWIADAHRDDGKRFVVRADEKLTAFLELEATIRAVEDQRIASG